MNLLQFECVLGWELIRGCSNQGLVSAWLGAPAIGSLIVIAYGIGTDGKCYVTGFAWLQIHLLESLELLYWAINLALLGGDVQLNCFATSHLAGIGYGHGEGELGAGC